MVELAMLADIQRTVYSKEVTCQLHVMAQARESSPSKTDVLTTVLDHQLVMMVQCLRFFDTNNTPFFT